MPLTDAAIRNSKPGKTPAGRHTTKPYKMGDAGGLYLEVTPTGAKWWRLKYRYGGKERRISLGVYPEVPLAGRKDKKTGEWIVKGARERRDEARQLLASGIDPGAHRKAARAATADRTANSFEVVAREWYAKESPTWAVSHGSRVLSRLENDVFPYVGRNPIADITPPEVLAVLRKVEERGAIETAHRELAYCGQIFRYAVATGRISSDPSRDLKGALASVDAEHFAAITDPKRVGDLLRSIDAYEGTPAVKCALRLAPLVFVRPGELRSAQWADIDLEAAEWRYAVKKTKKSGVAEHIVPLSTQAVVILKELKLKTGGGRYVFPGARSAKRPMSDVAILAALRRMEISKDEMTGHGFRAMARTILDEVLHFPPHLIEHQLAHKVRDPHGRAYNRTAHLPERHAMMQQWADYLDNLKAGAEVIPLFGKV